MSIYSRIFSVSLPKLIAGTTIALFVPLIYFAVDHTKKGFFDEEGPLWLFMVGLVPGLFVALLQFLLSWVEFSQISRFRSMRIKGVLDSRDISEYYLKIISTAQTKIDVEGVTASRLLRDFAEAESARPDKKVIITALKNGVKLRLLLPEKAYIAAADHPKYQFTAESVDALRQQFPGSVEVRYFSHNPTNSLVRVDDDIIVGPVFLNQASRHTPAIHTVVGGRYGQSYIDNFDAEWQAASPRW